MKKQFVVWALTALCVLMVTLSGCGSGGSVADFTDKVAGTWHRNGNLQDVQLEILDDSSWTEQAQQDGTWETVEQGVISYQDEYKIFNLETDDKFYPIEHSSDGGEVLQYKNDVYYRAEKSIDGFAELDGSWHQDGDKDSEYYAFANGEWKWFEPQGMTHVSVDYGNLAWDGTAEKLLAYSYADGEVFAAFSPSKDGELVKDGTAYVFLEELSEDESTDAEDDAFMDRDPVEGEHSILFNEFYYLDGEISQASLYFFDDGQVDYDESLDSQTIEAFYTIDGDEITIKTPDGQLMGTIAIMDSLTLVDITDGDIGDFYKIPKVD